MAEGQVGVGPAQEPEGRAKRQRTPRTASGPDDLATSAGSPGGQNAGGQQSSPEQPGVDVAASPEQKPTESSQVQAPGIKIKKKRAAKPKTEQGAEPYREPVKAAEEPLTMGEAVASAPETPKSEEPSPTYGQYEEHAEPPHAESGTPAEGAGMPAPEDVPEKGEEPSSEQKSEPPKENQETLEPGWKFDEQNQPEPAPANAFDNGKEEPNEASATPNFDPNTGETVMDTRALSTNPTEERKVMEEDHKLRSFLIALLICAVLYLLVAFLWHHVSINAVVPAAAQFHNFTANAVTNSSSGNSIVHVSGSVSPPPKSANSIVILSIFGPHGAPVATRDTPVLTSGAFNISITLGRENNLSNGTYTVDSNYYGSGGKTTFILNVPTTQFRNVTANSVTNSNSGNDVIQVSGVVSPAPKSGKNDVVISVAGPHGSVSTADAPISNTGAFSTGVSLGSAGALTNGTYTVTSSYHGTSNTITLAVAATPYNSPDWLVNVLCNIYSEVHSIVFLLSILLVILGAIVYTLGPIMPGTHKGQFQGYGMGMVIGGVVGSFIAIVAPYILVIIAGSALPVAKCISGIV